MHLALFPGCVGGRQCEATALAADLCVCVCPWSCSKLRNGVMLAENGVKLKMKAASYAQYLMGKGQSFVSNALICDLRRGGCLLSRQQRTNLSCACQYTLLERAAHQPLLHNPYPPQLQLHGRYGDCLTSAIHWSLVTGNVKPKGPAIKSISACMLTCCSRRRSSALSQCCTQYAV